jgi:hypothetical protein
MSPTHEPMTHQGSGSDLVDCSAELPCPFCGGQVDPAGWLGQNNAGVITSGPECDGCGATTETLEIWNKREPINGKVVVDAKHLANLLDYTIRNPYLDEGSPYRKSYNVLSQALQQSTPTQAVSSEDRNNG